MFKIIYGGFSQETNTFSPLICTRKNFEASHIYLGKDIPDKIHGTHNHFAGMLDVLLDAEDVQVIPTGIYQSGSYGYVDIAVADEFIELVIAAIRKTLLLTVCFSRCTAEVPNMRRRWHRYILNKLRKAPARTCSSPHPQTCTPTSPGRSWIILIF